MLRQDLDSDGVSRLNLQEAVAVEGPVEADLVMDDETLFQDADSAIDPLILGTMGRVVDEAYGDGKNYGSQPVDKRSSPD